MFHKQVFCRTLCRICIEVAVSSTNTKEFFKEKKKFPVANMFVRKLTANNEWRRVAHSSCFRKQYFVTRKNGFVPYWSCLRIVYSWVMNLKHMPLNYHEMINKSNRNTRMGCYQTLFSVNCCLANWSEEGIGEIQFNLQLP